MRLVTESISTAVQCRITLRICSVIHVVEGMMQQSTIYIEIVDTAFIFGDRYQQVPAAEHLHRAYDGAVALSLVKSMIPYE